MRTLLFIERLILFLILTCVPLVIYYRVSDPNIIKDLTFRIFLLIWGIVSCIKHLRTRQEAFFPTNLAFGVVLLLMMSVFSFVVSDYKLVGVDRIELIACFIFFFFLVGQSLFDRQKALYALEAAALGAFLVSLYGILQSFGVDFFDQRDLSRVFSTFGHPNFLASYLVCTIPLTVGICLSVQDKRRIYYGLSIATQSTCLFLTLTRGAFASTIAGLIFFAVIYSRNIHMPQLFSLSRKKLALTFLIVCVSAGTFISIAWNLPEAQVARLTEVGERSKENTLWLRWLEWKGTLQMIRKAPFFGNGIGTFAIHFPPNQPLEFSTISTERNEFLRHAHNEYLELWCEMGVLGPMILVFILANAILSGIRFIKFKDDTAPAFWLLGLVSGLFGLGVNMFFSVSFRFMVTPLIFWFFLGIINGLSQNEQGEGRARSGGKRTAVVVSFLIIGNVFLLLSTIKTIAIFNSEKDFHRGLVNWNSGRLKDALAYMQQALDNNSKKPEIYYKKGALEVRLEKWMDALRTYGALERINPNFFHINYNLSLCYLNIRDMKNSIASGKRQLEFYPDYVNQYFILGKAYYMINNSREAQKNFEKYLESDPKNASAMGYLGNIHAFRSEWEEAIKRYETVLTNHPEDPLTRLNLSNAYMAKGNLNKAIENLCILFEKYSESSFFADHKKTIQTITRRLDEVYEPGSMNEICPKIAEYNATGAAAPQ